MANTVNDGDGVIRFQAQVAQVKTMADGGIRFILDLSESAIDTAKSMMEARRAGALLEVAVIAVKVKNAGKSRKIKTPNDIDATY